MVAWPSPKLIVDRLQWLDAGRGESGISISNVLAPLFTTQVNVVAIDTPADVPPLAGRKRLWDLSPWHAFHRPRRRAAGPQAQRVRPSRRAWDRLVLAAA